LPLLLLLLWRPYASVLLLLPLLLLLLHSIKRLLWQLKPI
jgi:hypothetical protein